MKKSILLITDMCNDFALEEDVTITAKYLQSKYRVSVAHVTDAQHLEDNVDLVFLRNTWTRDDGYHLKRKKEEATLHERLRNKNIPTYNALNGSGEMVGKQHLVDLFKAGYPVIPSVDTIEDIDLLPIADIYTIKPKHGCAARGMEFCTKEELLKKDLWSEYIIQPKISFIKELAFFFIDDQLCRTEYFAPSKMSDDRTKGVYVPTKEEIEIAKKFVDWNTLSHGFQRVDFAQLEDGSMLLMELEDCAAGLVIRDWTEEERNDFLSVLSESIAKVI